MCKRAFPTNYIWAPHMQYHPCSKSKGKVKGITRTHPEKNWGTFNKKEENVSFLCNFSLFFNLIFFQLEYVRKWDFETRRHTALEIYQNSNMFLKCFQILKSIV